MHPILNIAIKAIRKGGNSIIQNYDFRQSMYKSALNSGFILNKLINYSEKIIKKIIYKFYPKHIVLIQQTFSKKLDKKNIYWVINTIDGILNYSRSFPHFCITISVYFKGEMIISVIYDPLKNELFSAVKGQGATLNGYRMRCVNSDSSNVIVSTNFFSINKNVDWIAYNNIIKTMCLSNINIRCTGSLSLDLAYIAAGRLSCFIGYKSKDINFSVGELQVKESGGITCNIPIVSNSSCKYNITFIGASKKINILSEKLKVV